MRAVLRYLRIEEADGGLSLTALAVFCGCAASLVLPPWFALAAFGIGLLGFHVERGRGHALALQAMETNQEIALAKRSDDAEKLAERMDSMEKKLADLATPERVEATKKLLEQLRSRVPGGFR